jgi:cytochrome P450
MKPSTEIPRPAGSLVSHSMRFVKDTMKFYAEAYRECGDIFSTRIPGLGNWVYVCSPELVKAMMAAPPGMLAGGEIEGFSLGHVLGRGASSDYDGAAHAERRAVTCPYMAAQASLRQVDEFRAIAERGVAAWPVGTTFPLVLATQRIALEALMTVFFQGIDAETVRRLADVYEDFSFKGLRSPAVPHSTLQVDLGPWSPWGQVKKRQKAVFAAFSERITARLAALSTPAGEAVDDLVLGMGRARLADGSGFSPEIIRTEILNLLFQGHELIGDAITWTLGELMTHPAVLARLRQELDAVLGAEGIRSSDLPKLPYLEAVVYEGLRVRPTNPFTSLRRVKEPFELGGYLLPPGTLVTICFPALSSREDLFAHPQSFDPEHFYGKSFAPEVWSPFGAGAHMCAGKDLALVVLQVALATIVRKTELKLAQDEVRPVRNAYYYEPNKGMLVTAEKRRG